MLVGHGGSPVILGLRKRRQRISRASWLANIWCIGEFWVQLREPDSMKKVESNSRRLGALHMSVSVQEQTHAHVPTHIRFCTPMLLCTTHICLEGGNISVWVSNLAMMGKLWLVGMVTKLSWNTKVECDQRSWAGSSRQSGDVRQSAAVKSWQSNLVWPMLVSKVWEASVTTRDAFGGKQFINLSLDSSVSCWTASLSGQVPVGQLKDIETVCRFWSPSIHTAFSVYLALFP